MKHTLALVLAAPLALAACQDRSEEPPAAPATAAASPAPSAPPPPAPPAVATATAIPAAFHGVWDYEKGSCDLLSDMRTEIDAKVVRFYESRGEVKAVTVESPQAVVLSLAMAGEGETWSSRDRYTLTDGGERLLVTPADGAPRGEPMPLKRCPPTGDAA